ncbi:uncharacterized protein LOC134205764 [Armigeres subalbatus]|uniref:uncharacterized protein LOC134205764 n=1 Tax=Armigeres subalbatus TaxID=124917 RepID=UPI002ED6416E
MQPVGCGGRCSTDSAMDFIKSLLPPLKFPKFRKIKQWNGASILNLSQLTSLPSRTRNVGTVASVATPTSSFSRSGTSSTVASISNGTKGHARRRSDISIISATVPTVTGNGNYGLYALKCDRNAAKRGILLNLPRKITAVVGGEGSLSGSYQSEEMVHEKFSPCKRVVEPPPRRKRMKKRMQQQQRQQEKMEIYCGDRLVERNRSELYRIAERGSNEKLDQAEIRKPTKEALYSARKTRSVDNILALKKYYPGEGEESDSDAEQVRSLKVTRKREWRGNKGLKYSESMESDSEEVEKRKNLVHGRLKKASDFSIENNSDEIEVRFKRNGSTESEDVSKSVALPLPSRVTVLRQEGVKPEIKPKVVMPKLSESPPKKVEKFVSSKDFADNFKPLASVLHDSIKSTDLKRKWINDFLSESDDEPVRHNQSVVLKSQHSVESLTKKFEMVDRFDRQLAALESGKKLMCNESDDSINIFKKTNADFDEFDKLFNEGKSLRGLGSVKKTVTVSEQITYIDQHKTNQLRYSSSSMDSDVKEIPIPPPLPPPVATKVTDGATLPKSTVKIQDYYDKKLQRVRYVSSPSPSRCYDEDSSTERTEAVNNNIVLPLSIINRTIVDNRITTEQVPTSAKAVAQEEPSANEANQNIYPETYNQSANNDHIPYNLEDTDNPSYVGHNQATTNSRDSLSHNVFIVGETFKRSEKTTGGDPVKRYVNYKFDDYCKIDRGETVRSPPTVPKGPSRIFNLNDFHDSCYNEEGVVII